MLQKQFSIRQFLLTNWNFLVHSTTRNAPYIHLSHDSILEMWQTFPNVLVGNFVTCELAVCPRQRVRPMASRL